MAEAAAETVGLIRGDAVGVWLSPLEATNNQPTQVRNNIFIRIFRSQMRPGGYLDSIKSRYDVLAGPPAVACTGGSASHPAAAGLRRTLPACASPPGSEAKTGAGDET